MLGNAFIPPEDQWTAEEIAEMKRRGPVGPVSFVPNRVPAAPIGLKPAEVTEAMRFAVRMALRANGFSGDSSWDGVVHDVCFAALENAPVPLVSDAEIALTRDRDSWRRVAERLEEEKADLHARLLTANARNTVLSATVRTYQETAAANMTREGYAALMAEEPGNHDYHGPTETVPHPTIDGQTERRAVPDPVHERFHGAVGDVLAGKVMGAARRQMQEALKQAPKDDPTTASTSKPMPGQASSSGIDPRRMGL